MLLPVDISGLCGPPDFSRTGNVDFIVCEIDLNGPHIHRRSEVKLYPLARFTASCPPPAAAVLIRNQLRLFSFLKARRSGILAVAEQIPDRIRPWILAFSGDGNGPVPVSLITEQFSLCVQAAWPDSDAPLKIMVYGYSHGSRMPDISS